jgi:hypothetical protein
MKKHLFGFVVDGQSRMREAIKTEVEREYEARLAATEGYWEKAAIKVEMNREVERRMNEIASPYSLWI